MDSITTPSSTDARNPTYPISTTTVRSNIRSRLPSISARSSNAPSMAALIPKPEPLEARPVTSMTSKTWEIPPRPKPGRKRATDTPPTKRQAQNRVAQRNFRDRRNALVSELEEQLAGEKASREKAEEQILTVEYEMQKLRLECDALRSALASEKEEREAEVTALRRRQLVDAHAAALRERDMPTAASLVQLTSFGPAIAPRPQSRAATSASFSGPQRDQGMKSETVVCGSCGADGRCACMEEMLSSVPAGCGGCTIGSKCACLEAAMNVPSTVSDLKRSISPRSAEVSRPQQKRQRSYAGLETDFTTGLPSAPVTSAMPEGDKCGFCQDGTYCVCAEAAKSSTVPVATLPLPMYSLPLSTQPQQTHTPPASENDGSSLEIEVTADGSVKLPGVKALSNRCGPGGPGTCEQCQIDPVSGLFCRLLAANLDNKAANGTSSGSGCCGKAGASGGCCRRGEPGSDRTHAEVETASIMSSMLKVLDRRFGRGA